VAAAAPNAGHAALARMERLMSRFLIATQNVDGLHQMAGSVRVVELHGNILRTRCSSCGSAIQEPRPGGPEATAEAPDGVSRCVCGGLGRPDVVWFGESLSLSAVDEVTAAATTARLVFVVGTSAVVYPAAAFAELGKASGARLVVVNPEETPLLSVADDWIPERAASALPEIAALVAGPVAGEGVPLPAAPRVAAAKPPAQPRRG
jgi:NAD-dependent deacetylase